MSISAGAFDLFIEFQASSLGTKQLDEEGLFQLIRERPGKVSKYEESFVTEEKVCDSIINLPQFL